MMQQTLIYIFALLCLYMVPASAEVESVDELLNKAESYRHTDPAAFNHTLEKLEQSLAQLSKDNQNHYSVLKAYSSFMSGKYDEQVRLLNYVINNSPTDDMKLRSTYGLIHTSIAKKDWATGFLHVQEALKQVEIHKTSNNALVKEQTKLALFVVIVFFNQLQQFDLALNYIDSIDVVDLTENEQCNLSMQKIEASQGNSSSSTFQIFQIEQALEVCEKTNWAVAPPLVRAYLAKSHLNQGNPQQAILTLMPFIEDAKATRFSLVIIDFYNTLAKSFFLVNNTAKSEYYADLAIESITHNSTKQTVDAYHMKYQLAYEKKDLGEALKFYIKYSEADKAYLNDITAKNIAFELAQNRSLQQKNKIELLNKENELLNNKNELLKIERSLTQSEAENTRLIATLLIAIVALLAFFGYRSWHSQRRLKVLAEYDHLTKINNRGHFMALAEETLSLAERAHQTASCIILDLDKFKSINDTYGHAAGDWALKAVVEAVKPCIRDHDIFARLGGEEFVILLPSCDIQAATFVTEKCLKVIEAIDTADSGNQFKITASFGITTTRTSGYQVTSLINDADKALYQSKENGRNQMTIFTNEDD
ncbi:MAG: GGDEF domain-containing protein [Thalassotalea sp.]|nr:GGDEF domain-containing protein [Thalassotalea sp.]